MNPFWGHDARKYFIDEHKIQEKRTLAHNKHDFKKSEKTLESNQPN